MTPRGVSSIPPARNFPSLLPKTFSIPTRYSTLAITIFESTTWRLSHASCEGVEPRRGEIHNREFKYPLPRIRKIHSSWREEAARNLSGVSRWIQPQLREYPRPRNVASFARCTCRSSQAGFSPPTTPPFFLLLFFFLFISCSILRPSLPPLLPAPSFLPIALRRSPSSFRPCAPSSKYKPLLSPAPSLLPSCPRGNAPPNER